MKRRKEILFILFTILILVAVGSYIAEANAHPGRTASDSCHYCRTNCSFWGIEWDQKHCHRRSAYVLSSSLESLPQIISEPKFELKLESEPGSIQIDTLRSKSQSAYTVRIQDKIGESYKLVYWLLGIIIISGAILALTRKK